MRHFLSVFLIPTAHNRVCFTRFLLFLLLSFTFFSKANTPQQVSPVESKGVLYIVGDAKIHGQINAEVHIVRTNSEDNLKAKQKSEKPKKSPPNLISATKKHISEKVRKEIGKVKKDSKYRISIPFSRESYSTSANKSKVFVIQDTHSFKILCIKLALSLSKKAVQPLLKINNSYYQFSVISKQYFASHFTRPPPEELII